MPAGRTLERLLADCRLSAVHLEMRDVYTLNDPKFDAWQAGHRIDLDDRSSWWRPWLQNIVNTVARSVEDRRARIVSEPVSSYIRYEYDITVPNLRAGEQVRWLPRRRATDLALPGNDFWSFDDAEVTVELVSGHLTITQPHEIALYAGAFAELAALAVYGKVARALITKAIQAVDG
ncbi:DUF6879 family protein [Streptosporangium sp. NPDC006013]|uniref:DUF6879 family protein n=1 Tax=Streptosporangium sp. NPDC006013 TaxID=3155596 RepID=UPI0033B5F97E